MDNIIHIKIECTEEKCNVINTSKNYNSIESMNYYINSFGNVDSIVGYMNQPAFDPNYFNKKTKENIVYTILKKFISSNKNVDHFSYLLNTVPSIISSVLEFQHYVYGSILHTLCEDNLYDHVVILTDFYKLKNSNDDDSSSGSDSVNIIPLWSITDCYGQNALHNSSLEFKCKVFRNYPELKSISDTITF